LDWGHTPLFLKVVSWSQAIGHGEGHYSHEFRISARTSDTEDLVIGAEGWRMLRNMPVHLSIIRGPPEKPPIHGGVGVLAYYPEKPPQHDSEGIEEFIGGFFWLPENSFDELWSQARDQRYDECSLELWFGPVEPAGGSRRWNTEKNKSTSITSLNVRFERHAR
jgi:hypothetical protein